MKKVYILEDLCDSVIVGVFENHDDAVKAACEYSCGCLITLKEVADFLSNEMNIREVEVQ